MSDLDNHPAPREGRRATGAVPTRYSEVITRFLSATGFVTLEPGRPATTAPARLGGTVLVGVDETPVSHIAVDHAAIEAEMHGWKLRLCHVQRPGDLDSSARDAGARLLRRLTDRVHACSPTVAVTSSLAVGTPSSLLLSHARGMSLVVVGHRHDAVAAFGQSVGEQVAGRHRGVVMVVRTAGGPPGTDFGMRPIVVGVDSAHSRTPAAQFALREAVVRGCDVVMVDAGEDRSPAETVETVDGLLVYHRTVRADPISALVQASGTAAAVVVGRRAPGTMPKPLLGSVSRAMVQRAHCSVFLTG